VELSAQNLPFPSNIAAPAGGAVGTVMDCRLVYSYAGAQVVVTGGPTSAVYSIEGSLDGTVFGTIASGTVVDGTITANTTPKPFRYLRSRVTSIAGGTTPTMTVYVAPCHT
jgi:hypothetical protein